ncbi:MAG: BBP7 family outer membrane beta-barrel protein [Candidatus Nealsonbacteria bacterium]|nr:BBP7 family outer membrane beta-barrel protein [Candidatus Nealsonbacteria bacterium]
MLPNRPILRLSLTIAVLLVALPGAAQDLEGFKLFAPADLSEYGTGPKPKEGYFFSFEGLHWYTSPAKTTTIGAPGLTRTVLYGPDPAFDLAIQANSMDTSFFNAPPSAGNRIELGHISDCKGWMLSTYRLKTQNQTAVASGVDMVFDDIAFGPGGAQLLQGYVGIDLVDPTLIVVANLPVTFDEVSVRNSVSTWNVELMMLRRSRPNHYGGIFEWYAGVRYLEFDEIFSVFADGDVLNVAGITSTMADSNWDTEAENHIVGPQLGLRWFQKRSRWTLSSEGRFMAGFNSQNLHQTGLIGSELSPPPSNAIAAPELFQPLVLGPTHFRHSAHITEWTPVVELRAELKYQVTRSLSFKVGWTGIWMDNIARASSLVNYELNGESANGLMGLLRQNNSDDVFTHGLTVGFDINH